MMWSVGATSGDSFGFSLYLLWMMTVYPLSVIAHLILADSPPGRPVSGSHAWFIAACAAITVVGLSAIIAIRRDETVVTRFARHFAIGSAFMVPMVVFAYFDRSGSLWTSAALDDF